MSPYAIIGNNMLQVGDQFDQYQIQAHVAQGGMSDIYRAFDLVNRRDVAIKIPDQTMIGDPAQYERFQRELEVMKTLKHPAILRGLGSGKYNRIPYLVTEFVNGQSLRTFMDETTPVPTDKAIQLIRSIADGMAYCHQNDVIHRDLKPENILITPDNRIVIMDFGLALTSSSHRVTYSNLSATMGTPDYMAPEQIEGQRGDKRTDIFALGIIFYEMLAGQTPFSGDTNLAVMAQLLNNTAPRLDLKIPAISKEIAAIVARCLARDPIDRYPDMPSLINDLDHPELADMSIIDRSDEEPAYLKSRLIKSQTFKAIGISIAVILAIVVLALALQALR
jgi:eukaryotic-like serine/threonine-protein kinase